MENINSIIDHTLLKPDATEDMIYKLCDETIKHGFRSACISSAWVSQVSQKLSGHPSLVTTVIGFPHGNCNLLSKVMEIEDAKADGADEFDVVINIGAIKSKKWRDVSAEIKEIRSYTYNKLLKYIIETAYLTDFEMKKVCDLLVKYEVDYVKTSTGYAPRGATIDDIKKLKNYGQGHILVKASGGIGDLKTAKSMLEAGADVIGTSKSLDIMRAIRNGKNSDLD